MSWRYRETWGDPPDDVQVVKPVLAYVDGETRRRARTVCKHILPAEHQGAIGTNCRNAPGDSGWCPEHAPK